MDRAPIMSRRALFTALGLAAAASVESCGAGSRGGQPVGPGDARVAAAEKRRRRVGAAVRTVSLVAGPVHVDLAGREVSTWGYNGVLPGQTIRLTAGEILRAHVSNRLPAPTSVHWHGIALRNDMDGVPDLTQPAIGPGSAMTYEFTVPSAGTYMFHPHSGTQLDRGLYGPLIVEDPHEPVHYDTEFIVVLDDWTDGVGEDPDAILARLRAGGMADMAAPSSAGGMAGMAGMAGMNKSSASGGSGPMPTMRSDLLGGDAGDVAYPLYLINGRAAGDPEVFAGRPGTRARLRVLNPSSDTAFRLALGGHSFTVTHTDGYPIVPITGRSLLVGMGERYDVTVTLQDGVFPLVALAEGKDAAAFALVRTSSGEPPSADVRPAELDGPVLTVGSMRAADSVQLPAKRPDRLHRVVLGGDMTDYSWTINGRPMSRALPLQVRQDEVVRLQMVNRTTMYHPMHLHGHTFQVRATPGGLGARKDTVIVRPGETVVADLLADNPGQWMIHCHNTYHLEAGMGTTLSYLS